MSFLAQLGRAGARRLAPRAGARVLYQAEQLRFFSEAPTENESQDEYEEDVTDVAEDEDIVLEAFRTQQQQYQALMKGLQNIKIPLTGDDAAVKQYAQEVESLKKEIGMPDVEEMIGAELNYKLACSDYDIRKFVRNALDGLKLDSMAGVANELIAAVDAAERESGLALHPDNDKGWEVLISRVEAIERKYGLDDRKKVREEAIFDMYKAHIKDLRAQVQDDIDKARVSENLEWIQPDLSTLKPRLV